MDKGVMNWRNKMDSNYIKIMRFNISDMNISMWVLGFEKSFEIIGNFVSP